MKKDMPAKLIFITILLPRADFYIFGPEQTNLRMKKIILISGILILAILEVQAQYRVTPNKPYSILSSSPGLVSITEVTAGIGMNTNSTPDSDHFFGLTTIAGYQLNGNFMAGAGTGLSFYDSNLLVPLFLDFRYSFLPRQLSPYIYADGGLLLMVSELDATKLFINPGVGARYSIGRKFAVNGSLGILTQVDGRNRASFGTIKVGGVYVF